MGASWEPGVSRNPQPMGTEREQGLPGSQGAPSQSAGLGNVGKAHSGWDAASAKGTEFS